MLSLHNYRDLIAELASKPISPSTVAALRKKLGERDSREILEIASVQSKAVKKFGAGVWMATSRAIEQASDQVVANYKASLMGDRVVIDMCGGIGGDAMALSKRGCVVTIDQDPQMTSMAAANLRSIDATCAAAVCADVTKYLSTSEFARGNLAVHIDPDRRPKDRRTVAPDAYSPGFEFVASLLRTSPACIVKLAPAADLDDADLCDVHRQWISFAGSVREQTILAGDCIDHAALKRGQRSATKLMRGGSLQTFAPDNSLHYDSIAPIADKPKRYLFDFDPAVRASGLSIAMAFENALSPLGGPSGFFTSDEMPRDSTLMQSYEVFWSGPADLKQIRKQLQSQSIRLQAIKVRNSDHDPASLMKSLANKSENGAAATLLIGRTQAGVYSALGR